MKCPRCDTAELENGICPVCDKSGTNAAKTSVQANPGSSSTEEMPEWKKELSRRLREIKQKKGADAGKFLAEEALLPLPFPEEIANPQPENPEGSSPPTKSPRSVPKISQKVTAAKPIAKIPIRVLDSSKTTSSAETENQPIMVHDGDRTDLIQPAPFKPIDIVLRSDSEKMQPPDMRHLIDQAVANKQDAEPPDSSSPRTVSDPTEEFDYSPKLLLLSRTLSGLIDFLIVLLCSVAMVIVEDAVSTIEVFDFISLLNALLLSVSIYFLYSLFFLGTTNQTVGMMITRLRVVTEDGKRASMGQVVLRCCVYLFSVAIAGAGLAWGFFDRRSRCLHDIASRTYVEPVG